MLAFAPAARASHTGAIVAPGGGEVKYTSADEVKTLPNGEVVLIYTNAASTDASFELTGLTSARMLAVGGGGGGGGIYCQATAGGKSPYSGGGGGGAGGFVELTNLYNAATYLVTVGTGGVAGVGSSLTTKSKADFTGENGSDTFITTNGIELVRALGGGGGGGQRAGLEGASGGGGAFEPTGSSAGNETAGGAALQGFAGGAGKAGARGGGGGGAGAPGLAGDAAELPGTGGDGRQSDITGTLTYYAGGGGGGNSDKTVTGQAFGIAGGQGGGGQGGNGRSPAAPTETTPGGDAKPGVDGTGGGGGGAGKNVTTAAGKGGTGTVIVRIETSLAGGLEKPADVQVKHDGEFHPIVQPSRFIEIVSGVNGGTEVGTYSVLVKPVHTTWKDGSSDPVMVTLVIYDESSLPETTVEVTGAPVTFTGADAYSWIDNGDGSKDLLIKFLHVGSYKFPGSTAARILAVGGGGGGGGIYCQATAGGKSPYSGGGGGGAGGFVELTNLYSEATYLVTVGTGGVAGVGSSLTTKSKADFTGKNGGDTFITTNGIDLVRALGGGGGGGQRAGLEGASGGGGAYEPTGSSTGNETAGGAALQGFAGGAGKAGTRGGGGGGAGAPGLAGDAAELPGTGGDGRQSSITNANNAAQSEWGWFAGGGGGGNSDKTVTGQAFGIAGGQGGGGQGGNGRSPAAPTETTPGGDAKPGVDGTGGGGGGAGKNVTTAAGKGGSGIVYVRISSAMRGEFKKPDPVMEIEYDRNAHTSIENNVFYSVEGSNIGTTVGVYVATAKLNPGVVWPGGGTEDATVEMRILPRLTTFTDLHLELDGKPVNGWEYLQVKLPEPVVTVDPEWAIPNYEWRIKNDELGGWKDWSHTNAVDVGEYELRVGATDTTNLVFSYACTNFFITKIHVSIENLRQRGWMAGDPNPPAPTCTVVVAEIARKAAEGNLRYYYAPRVGDDAAAVEGWSAEKPTEAGRYWIKAEINDTDNFDSEPAYAEFEVMSGLGGIFTDYIEITVGAHSPDLANYPYPVTLSETNPVGFLYSRAGENGNDLTFTDNTGTNILPYAVEEWNTNAVSTLFVRIPLITNGVQRIRLYWHVRDGSFAPDHHPEQVWTKWTREDWETTWAGGSWKPSNPYSPVSRDGYLINYWKQQPVLSKIFWTVEDAAAGKAGELVQEAELAFENDKVVCIYTNLVAHTGYDEMPVDKPGSFRIIYYLPDPEERYDSGTIETHIDYAVSGRSSWDDLKGDAKTLTLSGRVMLANDDLFGGTDPNVKHAVTDQSYWQTREVTLADGTVLTNDVFWTHEGESSSSQYTTNLRTNHIHKLKFIGEAGKTNTLWRFENIRIGVDGYGENKRGTHYYLPWSTTELPISSRAAYEAALTDSSKQGLFSEVGNIVMRNIHDPVDQSQWAVISSPCYTNGIGTIYFDVVNSQRDNLECYRLVVEVATATMNGDIPTDENAYGPNDNGKETDLGLIRNEQWKPYSILPLLHKGEGSAFVPQPETKELAIEISDVGAVTKSDNFYRVCVKVNCHSPCRFRIRRTAAAKGVSGAGIDESRFIILDNILVSYPNMTADLSPYGAFDNTRAGKQILGQGGAMTVPFPAAGQGGVLARAQSYARVNDFRPINPDSVVIRAQMFYRWRYLEQAFEPDAAGDGVVKVGSEFWRSVELWPADGLTAREPLVIPDAEGDLEFWYRADLNSPSYDYHDYSGAELYLNDARGEPLYRDETLAVTNHIHLADYDAALPSTGTDWFCRLRAGRSDWEGVRLITDSNGLIETNEMEVTADGTWRACVKTPKDIGTIRYRLEGVNRQTPGATTYARNLTRWCAKADLEELPSSVALAPGGEDDWAEAPCDAKTGYLMFRLEEAKESVYVARADWQDFNRWATAVNEKFVGNVTDTNSTTYVAQQIPVNWRLMEPSNGTNKNWREDFSVGSGEVAREFYPRNQPFTKARSINGWTAHNGMWTYGKWAVESTDGFGDATALQLQGCGVGYVDMISATSIPEGIDTIIYSARLAQFNEFGNVSYFSGQIALKEPVQDWRKDIVQGTDLSDVTFVTTSLMSEEGLVAFDGDASVSLFANYHPQNGAYEFRVSLGRSTDDLRLELYRWSGTSGSWKATPLGTNYVSSVSKWLVKDWAEKTGKMGGLFIATKKSDAGVNVKAGVYLGEVSQGSASTLLQKDNEFATVAYYDTSSAAAKLKKGSVGVLGRNCQGLFENPILYLTTVAKEGKAEDAGKFIANASEKGFALSSPRQLLTEQDSYEADWFIQPGRMERLSGSTHSLRYGFQVMRNATTTQKVLLQVSDHGADRWETVPGGERELSSFKDVVVTNIVRSTKPSDVRLQVAGSVGDPRIDVVLNSIELTQWVGQTTPGLDDASFWGYTNRWVYTSAWVNEYIDGPSTNRTVSLQPARATSASNPVSLRTPLLRGFGLFHIAWKNADPNAKAHVQIATDATRNNLITRTKESPKSGNWETVETLDFSKLGAEGEKTVYLNRRYPATGAVRIVMDYDVVAAAIADGRPRTNPTYGLVEITDAYVWDLPEYDMHSWLGWNFRASGWEDGSTPGPWANLTDGGTEHGLSGLLNNSLTDLADNDDTKYEEKLPHVQSPTFGANSIGAVDFRARLYNPDDLKTAQHPAVVTVYGAQSKNAYGEPTGWTTVENFMISNGFYRTYTMRFRPSDQFFAIRFAVKGMPGYKPADGEPSAEKGPYDPPLRVAIDDICIYERPPLTFHFRNLFVRPFRNADALKGVEKVRDIDDVNEQPLLGEAFGFQAEVEVESEEIETDDPAHPITVDLWYYPKAEPWGWAKWKDLPGAVHVTLEKAVGEKFVFRSTADNTDSTCPPQELEGEETYKIVQYQMVAHYYDKAGDSYPHEMSWKDWSAPPWNTGFKEYERIRAEENFAGFTLLESIAPKRAWINEVNFCECENGDGTPSETDQWVEIAVPSGIDMTGWQLRLYDMFGEMAGVLMTFGNGCPSSKAVSGDESHYDFYVVKGPKSALTADAKWMPITTDMSTVLDGILTYSNPFGFELVRPTGVVEHRAVVQGRNIFEEWGWDVAAQYSGTNLVRTLNDLYGVDDWVWAGVDSPSNRTMTVGVTNGYGSVAVDRPHPDWMTPMRRTPGAKNAGQYIDPNWFVYPNGGFFRILATVLGPNILQIAGEETNTFMRLTVQEGRSTNIVYEVDRWYQMGPYEVKPGGGSMSGPTTGSDRKSRYTLTLSNVTNNMEVTAQAAISDKLIAVGVDDDNPYRDAIMKWLGDNDGNFLGDEIIPGEYRGSLGDLHCPLGITALYWFGLDPTCGGWELWGGMGLKSGSSGSADDFPVIKPVVKANPSDPSEVHTNILTTCWLMITNANDAAFAAHPPNNLQGLANEQSSSYTGNWTSETFRIEMMMQTDDKTLSSQWHSMRQFVFGSGSFRGANDPEAPFAARIEITDPFSQQSPAWEWGWWKYADRGISPFTRFTIKSGTSPAGVSTLKKNDTLVW